MPTTSSTDHPDPDDRLEQIITILGVLMSFVDDIRDRIAGAVKEHYTIAETAEATGRAPYTVRRWVKEGTLRAIRVQGGPRGRLLVPREELRRLIAEGKGGDVPPLAAGE